MVTFVLLNGAAALASILAALATPGPGGAAPLLFPALCAYLILVHTAVLVAGLGGHLTAGGAAVVIAAAVALSAWRAWATPRDATVSPLAAPVGAASIFSLLAAAL